MKKHFIRMRLNNKVVDEETSIADGVIRTVLKSENPSSNK